MKFCSKCGAELMDEAVVCTQCGCLCENTSTSGNTKSEKNNGMAVAGFVCSFFIPLLGWIFGGIGIGKANKLGGKGKGLAIASLVIATVMFIVNCIVMYS